MIKNSMLTENKRTAKTAVEAVSILWEEDFFESPRKLKEISDNLGKRGNNFSTIELSMALKRARYLIRNGRRGAFKYIQKIKAEKKEILIAKQSLICDGLREKFNKYFKIELADLEYNFGVSGTCTAFLLRKILEKAIYLVFAKNSIIDKLEDKNKPGRLIGLEAMVDTAAREKIGGIPILLPKTAQEIKGIKFLGDASAHNPLTNVDMETILPQMPFIITAYKELAERII